MSLRRLGGRISSGASAPKPATEPRGLGKKLIFSDFTLRRGKISPSRAQISSLERQDGARRPQEVPQEGQNDSQEPQETENEPQEAPRRPPGVLQEAQNDPQEAPRRVANEHPEAPGAENLKKCHLQSA